MKKLFLLLVGCVLALSASAGIENSQLWGYYTGDASGVTGLGASSGATTTYRVGIFVPGDGLLSGTTMTGVNVPFPSEATAPTEFYVFVGTTPGGKTLLNDTVTTVTAGYNAVVFDTPISIPATGLYVTYQFTASGYPIGVAQATELPGSLYLAMAATGTMNDYAGAGYGVAALQIYVEGMVLPNNAATISSADALPVLPGDMANLTVNLASDCVNGVNSVGYTLTIDGQATQNTVNLATPIAGGLMKRGSFTIDVPAPAQVGKFDATISIDQVNGVTNETPDTATFHVNTLSRKENRLCVVEEFTGTGCGYCPRGWVGMEAVKSQKSDKAVVLALHQYNSSDPMYLDYSKYAEVGFDGAPQCAIDRKIYPDPYYGMDEEGILEDVDFMNQFLPTVAVTVEGAFTDSTCKKIEVIASTEFLTPLNGYTLAFAITADSLTGGTSYKQTNYFYSNSKGNNVLPSMPELAYFYKGGQWAKSSVLLTFNDVVIASSYVNYKTQVPAFGSVETGDVEERTYTITMPTKTALKNALRYDQIFVTALVIDENGFIANAARAHIPYANPLAVENVSVEQAAVKTLRDGKVVILRDGREYDMMGTRLK